MFQSFRRHSRLFHALRAVSMFLISTIGLERLIAERFFKVSGGKAACFNVSVLSPCPAGRNLIKSFLLPFFIPIPLFSEINCLNLKVILRRKTRKSLLSILPCLCFLYPFACFLFIFIIIGLGDLLEICWRIYRDPTRRFR